MDEKTKTTLKVNENVMNKLKNMSNDDIGEHLFNFIYKDKTKEFGMLIEHCTILEKDENCKVNLEYILNQGFYSDSEWPLIMLAVGYNNLDIVKILHKYHVRMLLFT